MNGCETGLALIERLKVRDCAIIIRSGGGGQ